MMHSKGVPNLGLDDENIGFPYEEDLKSEMVSRGRSRT